MTSPIYFPSAIAFREWLAANSTTATELLVGFYKVGTGRSSLSWSESVDEALCVGWIDGVRRRIDDEAYCIRFTPRKPDSIWSAVNVAKFKQLQADGRMTAAGVEAFSRRRPDKTAVYAHEQQEIAELSEEELAMFQQHPVAWAFFEITPPSYKKAVLHWLTSAKKADTRATRLAKLLAACCKGQRLRL